jgi:hypothetical protein
MITPFWLNDPTIIFNKEYIFQLWPRQEMTFEQKLNTISRTVIFMTILGFVVTKNWSIVIVGIITLLIILALYKLRKNDIVSSLSKKEGFKNNVKQTTTTNPVTL